uniref:Uncharacterized protein n=1 Tax=Rhizophora mucronata TaxID=61149 RepID=A0A2P2QVI5_RHIMU
MQKYPIESPRCTAGRPRRRC